VPSLCLGWLTTRLGLSHACCLCSFAAPRGEHITELIWEVGAGQSVVSGVQTAARKGCSTEVERFFSGGLSGASVSLLKGGTQVRKVFATGQVARDDYYTELAALQQLEKLGNPRFMLLLSHAPPRAASCMNDWAKAAVCSVGGGGVIVQRYAGSAAPHTSAAKLAVRRLLRQLALMHGIFHNDIKWANICVQSVPLGSSTHVSTYTLIDYQWASRDRPRFPYGHGVKRLDVEVGARLPSMRPGELAALSHGGDGGGGSDAVYEGVTQHVFGIAQDTSTVWRLTHQVKGDAVEETASELTSGPAAAADSLTVVLSTTSESAWVVAFRSMDGTIHATNGNDWWVSSSNAMIKKMKTRSGRDEGNYSGVGGGVLRAAQAGSIAALALPGGEVALYCVDATARSLHEMIFNLPEHSSIAAATTAATADATAIDSEEEMQVVLNNLTSRAMATAGRAAAMHGGLAVWSKAAVDTAVCAAVGVDTTRRVYYVDEDGGLNELAQSNTTATSRGWVATRLSDRLGMTIELIPRTLACVADPFTGTLVALFFVSPPVAPRSCAHDMYSAPCRGRLHELRLNERGVWSNVRDLSTWPLQHAGDQRSQQELGRLSPSLTQRLLVSRLHIRDWQPQQLQSERQKRLVHEGFVSVVYTTRNAALHEVILSSAGNSSSMRGIGGDKQHENELRREITAPHSHPELFPDDGSTRWGTSVAAQAVGGTGGLYAMRSRDNKLLSF
jgi:hypothetical protein